MLTLLASGTLMRDPQARQSAAGKKFVTALLRVPVDGGETVVASVIAFAPEVTTALLALSKGDAVSVSGRGKISEWQKNSETQHGLSITCDKLLTAYGLTKVRQAVGET